jgi:hypothetical protein
MEQAERSVDEKGADVVSQVEAHLPGFVSILHAAQTSELLAWGEADVERALLWAKGERAKSTEVFRSVPKRERNISRSGTSCPAVAGDGPAGPGGGEAGGLPPRDWRPWEPLLCLSPAWRGADEGASEERSGWSRWKVEMSDGGHQARTFIWRVKHTASRPVALGSIRRLCAIPESSWSARAELLFLGVVTPTTRGPRTLWPKLWRMSSGERPCRPSCARPPSSCASPCRPRGRNR